MKTTLAIVLAAVLSSICTAGLTAVIFARSPGPARSGDHGDPSLDARIKRLENSLARGFAPGQRAAWQAEAGAMPSPEQASARQSSAQQLAKLEEQFRAQPVARAWANQTESLIRDAFSSDEAVRMGVIAPLDARIQCRSSSCRIEARYPSEGAASDAAQILLMDIGSALPQTRMQTLQMPDGSSQLIVFAYLASPQARTPPRG